MEPKELHELIELISRSNLQSFELEQGDLRLKLVKQEPLERASHTAAAPVLGTAEPARQSALAAGERLAPAPADGAVEFISPIVGTFYRAPSPAAPNFVEVGSRVTRGQVLCIVEAMKVMNEIESEIDAEIVEILATSGQPVEYGEVLFRLRPL